MTYEIFQVDAFTNKPFSGNPAAVCILTDPSIQDEKWMQLVAREMNLQETAYLYPEKDGFRLRWFTPKTEEQLCGHATLSAAHILWEQSILPKDQVARFYTRSGLLTAKLHGEWIELNFPAEPVEACEVPDQLETALGCPNFSFVGKNRLDYFIEVDNEYSIHQVTPDFKLLHSLMFNRGIIITSRSQSAEFDFISRFFDPNEDNPEDPVTGSAHCALGPYWEKKLNKTDLIGYQASERGGIVKVKPIDQRVLLFGQAITVLRCVLIS
ncbi:PhzF family phenazine biosynthesis protein [Shimazuella kribbensis]|uniref:PhzF family phenazine biosynthesis protein n=1 Tax=Shimazuella kribbensis TaxID=139808 RepID=UPI0003FF93D3|nr:PhzF family phenazine biosynthesis protein [Shimazuella kribbensis]